jgi:hypothetical protein
MISGWELGEVIVEGQLVTGNAVTVVSPVRTGKYALRVHPASAGAEARAIINPVKGASWPDDVYVTCWIRIAARPTEQAVNLFYWDLGRIQLNTDGTLQLDYRSDAGGTFTNIGSASAVLSLDAWHRIDFSALNCNTGTSGNYGSELKVDGSSIASGSNLTNGMNGLGNGNAFTCGHQNLIGNLETAVDVYYDDFIARDDAFQSDSGGVLNMKPNAAGNYTAWTGTWSEVDDVPVVFTDKLTETVVNDAETEGLVSAATAGIAGTITSTRVWARCDKAANLGGNSAIKLRIRSNSFDDDDVSAQVLSTTQQIFDRMADIDPGRSAAWTLSGLDAVEVGLVLTTAGGETAEVGGLGLMVWSSAPNLVVKPIVTSISPVSGPKAGGTAVTITGENFTGATAARIGDVALTSFVVVSDTSITGTTASIQKAGLYSAQVFGPTGIGTLINAFTYTPGNSTASGQNNGAGSTTVGFSTTTWVAGDMILAIITVRGGTGTTITPPTANGTWNLLSRLNSTTVLAQAIYWKLATQADINDTQVLFTITSNKASAIAIRVIDVDTGIAPQSAGQANASSVNIAAPTLTPRRFGSVSTFGGGTAVGDTIAPPTNYTEPTNGEQASTGGSAATRTTTEGSFRLLVNLTATGTITGVAGVAAVNIGHHAMFDPPTTISPVAIDSAEVFGALTLSQGAGGPSNSTISPSAIASAEAFGPALRLNPIQLQGQGIPSAESFGTPTLIAGNVNIQPVAIGSSEAFGTPIIQRGLNVIAISSAESLGTVTLLHGNANIQPTSIASAEAFGNPSLVSTALILPSAIGDPGGFASGPFDSDAFETQFGNLRLVVSVLTTAIVPTAIPSAESFGTPTLLAGGVVVSPSSISTAEAVGSHTLKATANILPSAIQSVEAVGIPTFIATSNIIPTAIPSAETFGTPSLLAGGVLIQPVAISSTEVVSTPVLKTSVSILPSAIGSAESFGTPSLVTGGVLIQLTGVASAEVFGAATLLHGNVNIQPTAIDSAEVFGDRTRLDPIRPTAIPSGEAFGSPILATLGGPRTLQVSVIVSAESFAPITLLHGNVNIIPSAIGSTEAFGAVRLAATASIAPSSIASSEAFGTPSLIAGGVQIAPPAIVSQEIFGSHTLLHGGVVVSPNSVVSGEALPSPVIIPGTTSIVLSGIPSAEVVSQPTLFAQSRIGPAAITSAELFGLPILKATSTIIVEGVVSAEEFGQLSFIVPQNIIPTGIPSDEQFGLPLIQGAKSGWKWTGQSGFAGTRTGGWPETQPAIAGTVKNEGES